MPSASVVLSNLLDGPDAPVVESPEGHTVTVDLPPLTGYVFEPSYAGGP